MKLSLKPLNGLILAGLLTTVGASAVMAQAPAGAPAAPASAAADGQRSGHPHGGHHKMSHQDPAKMQAWMQKRQAELKAKLKITASQEAAWGQFTAAMQPPAGTTPGQRPTAGQRAELDKLTTPERIDRMRTLRTERMAQMTAEMDRRGNATKAFYATLTAEQQKTFDAEHRAMGRHEKHGHSDDTNHKGQGPAGASPFAGSPR